jgi:hypothetical protein
MSESGSSDLLPSVAQILKQAGALERMPGADLKAVSRLPVFQSTSWKRAIAEFLRWSGSTPEAWGSTSVFELILCHGPAGARALFEAYRHDRLERAASFEEAEAQLEAVRTIVSMAAYWVHVISWDLRDARRLSVEEFRNRHRTQGNGVANAGREGSSVDHGEPRLADMVEKLLYEERAPAGRARVSSGVPVFPGDSVSPSLWRDAPAKSEEPPTMSVPPRWRPRPSRP